MPPSIYTYIREQESDFESDEIQVADNWYWNFRNHVQLIFHLKNGIFYTGDNNWTRAFRNIMEPILNLAYWTEDLEVKDVVFYLDDDDDRALSFLVKKYHDAIYVKEHNLDTLFDEITESDLDYGGALVQKSVKRPEVIQLNTIAFCDQTDILGSAIGFKHHFSPSKLREMSKFGWGSKANGATISIDELCVLADDQKSANSSASQKNKVPSKTIEVYIVKGNLPDHYLNDNDDMEYYCEQTQIVAFYQGSEKKEGVTLYRKKGDSQLMFHTSKKVEGRALGRGVGEAILHEQIWGNFLTIHKMKMLEAGSKVPLYTDDPSYTQKNKIQDMETLEVTVIEDGKQIRQVPTIAVANLQMFENEINALYAHAQTIGNAQDPLLGKEAPSGTTFRGQERSVAQGRGSHDRRRGQRAKFIEEIYREFIIPDIQKEITKGKKFLATLSSEELSWVADQMAENLTNKRIKDIILSGKEITTEEQDTFRQVFKQNILKKGNKQLHEILKDEFKDIGLKMGINIAGKQKDLVGLSDKILSVFQFALANPIPQHLVKPFNDILEYGGLSPVDFATVANANQQMMAPETAQKPVPSPLQMVNPAPVQ